MSNKTACPRISAALVLLLAACGSDGESARYDAFVSQLEGEQIGSDVDHWIEMKNFAGEWEKTGLIFGYVDDYGECEKAIAGMTAVNYAREYRCVPAN